MWQKKNLFGEKRVVFHVAEERNRQWEEFLDKELGNAQSSEDALSDDVPRESKIESTDAANADPYHPQDALKSVDATTRSFLEKAQEVHSGLRLGHRALNMATLRPLQAASKTHETDVLLRNATKKRTHLHEKAIASLESTLGWYRGAAVKRIEEIDAAIHLLQDSIAALEDTVERRQEYITRLKNQRLKTRNIFRLAKNAAEIATEKVGAARRYATGSLTENDEILGYTKTAATKATLEHLLTQYQRKKGEYEGKKREKASIDDEKIAIFSDIFEMDNDRMRRVLGDYFDKMQETPFLAHVDNVPALLRTLRFSSDQKQKLYLLIDKHRKNPLKLINEILDTKAFGKLDPRTKNILLLFQKIEKASADTPELRGIIFNTLKNFSSASRLTMRQEAQEYHREQEKALREKIQEKAKALQRYFSAETEERKRLAEGKTCAVEFRGFSKMKKMRVERVEKNSRGEVTAFSLVHNDKKSKVNRRVIIRLADGRVMVEDWKDDNGKQVVEGDGEKRVRVLLLSDVENISDIANE